jgi:integrase
VSVRKRTWVTRTGDVKEAWIVAYSDQDGKRHIRTFDRKKDAEGFNDGVRVDVRRGVHTPENRSITVAEAARHWIEYVELEGREWSTVEHYRQHVKLHIVPRIGGEKLTRLTTPRVNAFRDDLLRDLSRSMARKVMVSFKSILKDARRRGNLVHNPADGVKIEINNRSKRRITVGVDVPTTDEIRRILDAAKGRWRPFLIVAAFTGMRASELRGLRWDDVDVRKGELHVRQRADAQNTIGRPKSRTSERTIPLGPFVMNTLTNWKRDCPDSKLRLVFPTGEGGVESHSNIVTRGYWPAQITAGVVVDGQGKDGKTLLEAKYSGLHALRHFYASWCINCQADGGLELPVKVVQERLGHGSIVMTSDVYGHMFPRRDDGAELAAAETALMGLRDTDATYGAKNRAKSTKMARNRGT